MSAPLFSVVIPTFERPHVLSRCLAGFAPGVQKLGPECYEVIVTDAGTGGTAERLVQEQHPWARWTPAPGRWPGANRNHGARRANGEWLVFVDDDCLVEPGFLASLERYAATGDLDVIEGKIICPDALDSPFYLCPFNCAGGVFWTANLTVRRKLFVRLGGFDEDLGRLEDMEFAHRIRTLGLKTVFAADAAVFHPRLRQNLGEHWRRSLQRRWTTLYHLKTGRGLPLGASNLRVLLGHTVGEGVNLIRTTYHLISRHDPKNWRTRLFAEVWQWITLPVMLPYLLWWEFQFRRRLKARAASPP